MATVKAFIRTSKKKADKVNIRFRLSDGRGVQIFHVSEIFVNPDLWDEKEQAIGKRQIYKDKTAFNKAINDRKGLILTIYEREPDKSVLKSEWLDTAIDKELHPEKYNILPKYNSLLAFIDYFISEAPNRKDDNSGRNVSKATIKQYSVAKKHLLEFIESKRKKDYFFGEIDKSFYAGYVSFLEKKGYSLNNIGKDIKTLKTFLNAATMQGYNNNLCFHSFKVFREEADSISLNENELSQIKDLQLNTYLDRVRDWFLLLAWTGCRFSDLEKVGKTDIKDGFISFRQQKTNTKVTIPLHPIVLEILEKYNYSLPDPISNQKFNEYIKEVAKLAGINSKETITITKGGKLITEQYPRYELISSHTGRRSFCTNMYKRGLPTLMIMSISGHKTEKSFLKYIKVKQSEHAEMMKKAWDNMYKSK